MSSKATDTPTIAAPAGRLAIAGSAKARAWRRRVAFRDVADVGALKDWLSGPYADGPLFVDPQPPHGAHAALCYQSRIRHLIKKVFCNAAIDKGRPSSADLETQITLKSLKRNEHRLFEIIDSFAQKEIVSELYDVLHSLLIAAVKCGNLDLNSDVPRGRMRRMRARKERERDAPRIAKDLEQLRQLLERAPRRIRDCVAPAEKRKRFKKWLKGQPGAPEIPDTTLSRRLQALVPSHE